jgi:hypothetical protein
MPVEQQWPSILLTAGCQRESWGEPSIEEIIVVRGSAKDQRETRPATGTAEDRFTRSLGREHQTPALRKACDS